MITHLGKIKAVIDLHKKGYTVIKIAKTLNLHIDEVVTIINDYA